MRYLENRMTQSRPSLLNLHLKRITQQLDLARLGLVALVLTGNQTMVTLEGFCNMLVQVDKKLLVLGCKTYPE